MSCPACVGARDHLCRSMLMLLPYLARTSCCLLLCAAVHSPSLHAEAQPAAAVAASCRSGPPPLDAEEIREAVEAALLRRAPTTLVRLIGKNAYARCAREAGRGLRRPSSVHACACGRRVQQLQTWPCHSLCPLPLSLPPLLPRHSPVCPSPQRHARPV